VTAPVTGAADRAGVTDAQVHVWLDSTPKRPWPDTGVEPQRVPALGYPELLDRIDAAGVSRALLVPPTWEGPRNDYVREAVTAHTDRFAFLARVDPTDPRVVERVARWRSVPGLLGVRLSVNRGDRRAQIRAATDSGFFAAAQQHELPVSVYMPGSFTELGDLATSFPDLRITVDHLALDNADRPLPEAIEPLLPLATHRNLAVKASALPCFVPEPFPYPSIGAAVTRLVAEFGSPRVFWGSDLSRLPCGYGDLVAVFRDHMTGLDAAALTDVLGGALAGWLGWPVAAALTRRTA
jgi:predicted TIM-barrel fold metal-dependent hydrolase